MWDGERQSKTLLRERDREGGRERYTDTCAHENLCCSARICHAPRLSNQLRSDDPGKILSTNSCGLPIHFVSKRIHYYPKF